MIVSLTVLRDQPIKRSEESKALMLLRHMLVDAMTSGRSALPPQNLIIFSSLIQKMYLALEAAETAFDTWNLVSFAIATRTALESAAMTCALVHDPSTGSRMRQSPTRSGQAYLHLLSKGDPAIAREEIDFAISLAHPSSEAFRLTVSTADFSSSTATGLLGRWGQIAGKLQGICAKAGLRAWQCAVLVFGQPASNDLAEQVDQARSDAAIPENLDKKVQGSIEILGRFSTQFVMASASLDLVELRTSERARLKLFATQYMIHSALGLARTLQFANPDGFIAIARSWMEALAVSRAAGGAEPVLRSFLQKKRAPWDQMLEVLETELPDVRTWYKEASPYPHASLLSLAPRLLHDEQKGATYSVLMPVWDLPRLHTWLDRADRLVVVSTKQALGGDVK